MNRVNAAELATEYDGNSNFPYDASDLANYLIFLCHSHDLTKVKEPASEPGPGKDDDSTEMNEMFIDSSCNEPRLHKELLNECMFQDESDSNFMSDDVDEYLRRNQSETCRKRQKTESEDTCKNSLCADFDETADHAMKKVEYDEFQKTAMNMNPKLFIFDHHFTSIFG